MKPTDRSSRPPVARSPSRAVRLLVEEGRAWISTIRWRAAAWVLGITLATVATIMFAGVAVLPALGVAAAAAVVSINRVAVRLAKPVCLGCGHDMNGQPMGPAGAACPSCGLIHQPRPGQASVALDWGDADDEADPPAAPRRDPSASA